MSIPVSIHATVYPSMTAAPNKSIEAVIGELLCHLGGTTIQEI